MSEGLERRAGRKKIATFNPVGSRPCERCCRDEWLIDWFGSYLKNPDLIEGLCGDTADPEMVDRLITKAFESASEVFLEELSYDGERRRSPDSPDTSTPTREKCPVCGDERYLDQGTRDVRRCPTCNPKGNNPSGQASTCDGSGKRKEKP